MARYLTGSLEERRGSRRSARCVQISRIIWQHKGKSRRRKWPAFCKNPRKTAWAPHESNLCSRPKSSWRCAVDSSACSSLQNNRNGWFLAGMLTIQDPRNIAVPEMRSMPKFV